MHPYLGLALAKEIQRDRLDTAAAHRAARQAHTPLFATPLFAWIARRAKKPAPRPVLQVRPERATAAAAPMGCTA
jgi:hypothetical protein